MNLPKTLKVKPRHIKQGTPEDPRSCPIAISLEKSTSLLHITVEEDTIYLYNRLNPEEEIEIKTSPELRQWIEDFDESAKARSIEIAIDQKEKTALITRYTSKSETKTELR